MRKPHSTERVRCPEARSNRTHPPLKVWEAGKNQLYGILDSHKHGMGSSECPYSHLPVKVEKN